MSSSGEPSRYYIVRIHVATNAATPRVYQYKDGTCDGEIVCLDAQGRSIFKEVLFRRGNPCFYAFDPAVAEWPGPARRSPSRTKANAPASDSRRQAQSRHVRSPCEISWLRPVQGYLRTGP